MVFLNPWAFSMAGLVPAIVLLYLLKVKRRPLAVSTLLFWQQVLQENRRRALFQRLRQLLSLLLHLLIFALVLLALTRPVLNRLVHSGSATVLVLDTRARMQALEPDGATRFARAVAEAQRFARQAGALGQVAILTGGGEPSVVVPFTGDEKRLREGLAQLRATDAGGELAPALRLGHELLASHAGEHRLILLTDRPVTLPDVEVHAVGSPRENVALLQFAARPLPTSPETSEVLLTMQNFGSQLASGQVELSLDDRVLDIRPYQLAPGEVSQRQFPLLPDAGDAKRRGWLVARLSGHDALPLDDIALASLPAQPPISVLLVTAGNWFLEKLLEADPRVRFELLSPDSFTPGMAAKFQAVIFDDYRPPGQDLAALQGNLLFLGHSPLESGAPEIAQPAITDIENGNPLLRGVKLERLAVARSVALAIPKESDGWRLAEPLRFADRPLLVTGTRPAAGGEQRMAALAFRVLDSDLPLRVAFPLLISNAVQWLAAASSEEALQLRAGESVPLAAGTTVTGPFAQPPSVAPKDESRPSETYRGVFQPLTNGFYREQSGEQERWLAVNTASAAEADLRRDFPPTAEAPRTTGWSVPLPGRETLQGWPLWQVLTLAALGLFTGEWWLFHRRRTE